MNRRSGAWFATSRTSRNPARKTAQSLSVARKFWRMRMALARIGGDEVEPAPALRPQHHRAAAEAVGIRLGKRRQIGRRLERRSDKQKLHIRQQPRPAGSSERPSCRRAARRKCPSRRNRSCPDRPRCGRAASCACSGPGSARRHRMPAEMWSCRLRPTPLSGAVTAMPCGAQIVGVANPRQHQQLRRVDDPAGEDHLALGTHRDALRRA